MNQMGFSINVPLDTSQFRTSKVPSVQNFAKNNTENAELASKMLQTAAFSVSTAKTCTQEPSRSSSGENVPEKHLRKFCLVFILSLLSPTLFWSSGCMPLAPVTRYQRGARARWGTHGNIK